MNNLRKKIRLMFLFGITTAVLQSQIQVTNTMEEANNGSLADVDIKTIEYPLHKIILDQNLSSEEKLQRMQDLLENGSVNINLSDADGRTALNLATFYSADPLIIQFLIDHNAKVNEPDRFNETPLHNAITKEQIQVAKMLLAVGANPDLHNDMLQTPVDLARSTDTKALFNLEDNE